MKTLASIAIILSLGFTVSENTKRKHMGGESSYILVSYEQDPLAKTKNPLRTISIIYDQKKIESINVQKDQSVSDKVVDVLNRLSVDGYRVVCSTSVRRYDEMRSTDTNAVQYGKMIYFLKKG